MKLKISELKPNPFKKEINDGKLNREQIDKIKANIEKLGLMGSLPIFKKDDKYFLIAGHHRLQALKEVYGKDFEVEVDFKRDYSEDQIFRGMVVENLTQRSGEFKETNTNVVAIEKYLNGHKDILLCLRDSRKHTEKINVEYKDKACSKDIALWLDNNTGGVMSHDEINDNLNIFHKLDTELREKIEKDKRYTDVVDENPDNINVTQAILLSKIEDKKEQKDLAKSLKESKEQRSRQQRNLITAYKEAPEEVKEKVRKGEVDIADIEVATIDSQIKESNKGGHTEFIPNFETRLKDLGYNVTRLEQQVAIFRKVFGSNTFNSKYRSLGTKEKKFLDNSIYDIRKRIKKCYDEVEFFISRIEDKKLLEVKNEPKQR